MRKNVLAALLAAVFVIMNTASALPAIALVTKASTRYPTPEGYNDNDYQKLVTFLETEDEEGLKNGKKLNSGYDLADPETWFGINWSDSAEMQVSEMNIGSLNLVGELDLSGCAALEHLYCYYNALTKLDLSGCAALKELSCDYNTLTELDVSDNPELVNLYCKGNKLTELDLSRCTALKHLNCYFNTLTELDVSNNSALLTLYCFGNALTKLDVSKNSVLQELGCRGNMLTELDVSNNPALLQLDCGGNALAELDVSNNTLLTDLVCYNNALTELDVSSNSALEKLCCYGNALTELDLSSNPLLPFDYIQADGNGSIGYDYDWGWDEVTEEEFIIHYAAANNGAEFLGWFTEDGELIWREKWLEFEVAQQTRVVARFTGWDEAESGDANGDGSVNSSDALIILRYALGLIELPCDESICDINGDGMVNSSDALVVLRIALGFIS